MRNLLATLGLSAGTPMLLGGDELGHTQHGDNNAYCMDDETSWRAWSDSSMAPFVERVFALRRSVPELRRDDFFYGRSGLADGEVPDIAWLSETSRELGPEDWGHHRETLVVRVSSASSVLLVLHAGAGDVDIELPAWFGDTAWAPELTSTTPDGTPESADALPCGGELWRPSRRTRSWCSARSDPARHRRLDRAAGPPGMITTRAATCPTGCCDSPLKS